MTLILLQTMIQSIASTLNWVGFYVGIRSLPGDPWRRRRWAIGSAIAFAAWLATILLLAGNDFFRSDVRPPRIPMAWVATLGAGYLLLLSRTFREIIAGIPQHWLIAIQTFRILGGVFLVRYFQGELSGVFAIPAGGGGVLTGLFAPLLAHLGGARRAYAPPAAILLDPLRLARLRHALPPPP